MTDYCDGDDIKDIFGITNVERWADLDGDEDETKIAARIAKACANATEEINDFLRESRYAIPLVKVGGSTPSATVVQMAAKIAGCWLHDNRGAEDGDEDGKPDNKLQVHRNWARNVLREILAGQRRIDSELAVAGKPTAPQVVIDSLEDDSTDMTADEYAADLFED